MNNTSPTALKQLEDALAVTTGQERIDRLLELAWALRDVDPLRGLEHGQAAYQLVLSLVSDAVRQLRLPACLVVISACYERLGRHDQALAQAQTALTMFQELGDAQGQASALRIIGNVYLALANYPEALAAYLRVLDNARAVGDAANEAAILSNIGYIYHLLGEYQQELETFRTVIAMHQAMGSLDGEAIAYNNIAMTYQSLGDAEQALAAAQRSLVLAEQAGMHNFKANVLCTIGELYSGMGAHKQALAALDQSVALAIRTGARSVQAYALLETGRTYTRSGEAAAGWPLLEQALALAEELALPDETAQCHLALAEAYKQMGDFEQALAHHEDFYRLRSEILNEETNTKLQQLQMLHSVETLRREREIYQLRNVELEHEISERRRAEAELQQVNAALQTHIYELSVISRVTHVALAQTNLQSILDTVTEQVAELLGARGTIVALLNAERTEITFVADYDKEPLARNFTNTTISLDSMPFVTDLFADPKPVVLVQPVIDSIIQSFDEEPRAGRFSSMLLVPLMIRGEAIGGLIITSDQEQDVFTEANMRLVETLAGQIAGIIERARLLDEAVRAREAAEVANLSKSQFLATMSHELRTPLTGILGYTQLLRLESALDPQQRGMVALIEQSSNHLLLLINDLLDLARIEAGRFELYEEPFDLSLFLYDVATMAGTWAQHKHLVLHTAIDDFHPSKDIPRVRADVRRLRQVLINLVGNAVKFTESGAITLSASTIPSEEPDDAHLHVRFCIHDTGIGIPQEELEHIFAPFYQVGDEHHRAAGTGLGLAICMEILRLMNSELHVESTLGEGSRFWFDLLLAIEPDTDR
ncbi:MAG TPA: tetratricopeptide repeat protein [Roseiflexaceae bacterium]|nr:tetratricopeptide repeat protein [Roseiflexaceae bacterium]